MMEVFFYNSPLVGRCDTYYTYFRIFNLTPRLVRSFLARWPSLVQNRYLIRDTKSLSCRAIAQLVEQWIVKPHILFLLLISRLYYCGIAPPSIEVVDPLRIEGRRIYDIFFAPLGHLTTSRKNEKI